MGLDTTHEAWHGSYGSFNRWRDALVVAAGYELIPTRTADGFQASDYRIPEWDDRLTRDEVEGNWERSLDEPLVYLLWHSDCDGEIKPKQAALIADRLAELLPNVAEEQHAGYSTGWRDATQAFIDGCRAAVAANEPVEFW